MIAGCKTSLDFLYRGILETQRERLLIWVAVTIACGIGFYFSLSFEPELPLAGMVLTVLTVLLVLIARMKWAVMPLIFVAWLFSLGFTAAVLRTAMIDAPMLERKINIANVRGTIVHIEGGEAGESMRLVLGSLVIEKLSPDKTPARIRLSSRKALKNVAVGQTITVLAGLNPPSPPVYPGRFDFRRYLYFQGIGAVGFIYRIEETGALHPTLERSGAGGFWLQVEKLRRIVDERIERAMPPREGAMAQALITGNRQAVAENDLDAMRDSGLAHLLAISGLHIGLLSGFVFFVVRLGLLLIPGMAIHHPVKKYAAVAGLLSGLFYALLAGAGIPAQRAVIMTGIAFLAIMVDRWPFSLRLVAAAAIAVLLLFPDALLSASFHLSFAAVGALILFYESLRPVWRKLSAHSGVIKRAGLYILGVCLTSVIATVATAPFTLYHFQKLAMLGVFANVTAVPLTAFIIIPFAVIGLFLMPVGLEYYPLAVMRWGIAAVLDTAHRVAELDYAVWRVPAIEAQGFLWLVAGVIFLCFWQGRMRLLGLIPVLYAAFLISSARPPDILISPSTELIGIRTEEGGLAVSTFQKERFFRSNWEQAFGLPPGASVKWPAEGMGEGGVSCDFEACRMVRQGHRISFLKHTLAYNEECRWANIVVTDEVLPKGQCKAAVVIDGRDAYYKGVHAIWLEERGEIYIRTVEGEIGARPWR